VEESERMSANTAWTSRERGDNRRGSTAGRFGQEDDDNHQPSSLLLAYKRYRIGERLRSHEVEVAFYLIYLLILTWSKYSHTLFLKMRLNPLRCCHVLRGVDSSLTRLGMSGVSLPSQSLVLSSHIFFAWVAAVVNVQDLGQGGGQSGGNPESFFTSADVRRKFESPLLNISSANDWFTYFNATVLSSISPLVWYDGKAMNESDLGWPDFNQPGALRTLGPLSVRQVRIQKNSCPSPFEKDFRDLGFLEFCYGPYKEEFEDNNDFGPMLGAADLGTYVYSNAEETGEAAFTGQVATYGGGGFRLLFKTDGSAASHAESVAQLDSMYKNRWIDRQTRAIFVDFNLYSPVTNTISMVRLLCEMPGSGGIITKLYMQHVSLGMLYMDYARNNTLFLEAMMLFLLLVMFIVICHKYNRLGAGALLQDRWSMFDIATLLCFLVAYAHRWRALDLSKFKAFPPDSLKFTNYSPEAYYVRTFRNCLGLCALLSWTRLLKTIRRMPFMRHVFNAVSVAMPSLIYLAAFFTTCLFGFSLSHYLAFGDTIFQFRTLHQSMLQLWKIFLGRGHIADDMISNNMVLGALFYVAWSLLSCIIFLYLFLGAIVDGYFQVKGDQERIAFGEFLQNAVMRPMQRVLVRYNVPLLGDEAGAMRDTVKVRCTRRLSRHILAHSTSATIFTGCWALESYSIFIYGQQLPQTKFRV